MVFEINIFFKKAVFEKKYFFLNKIKIYFFNTKLKKNIFLLYKTKKKTIFIKKKN